MQRRTTSALESIDDDSRFDQQLISDADDNSFSLRAIYRRETHAAYRVRTTLHTSAITIGERINQYVCVWRECECPDLVEVF